MAVSQIPHISLRIQYDMGSCEFIGKEMGFENHLSRILIPAQCLGAGGGSGKERANTSRLNACTNLTYCLLGAPGTDAFSDCGHADLRFGYPADQPILDGFLDRQSIRRPNHEKHEFKTDASGIVFFHTAFLHNRSSNGHYGEYRSVNEIN
jgi:hypothetical protein